MPPKQGSAKKTAASKEERELLKVANQNTGGEKEPVSEEDDDLEDDEFDEEDEEFDEDEEDDEGKTKGGNSNQVGKHMRTLFIKNLPTETTPEQVKALSIDILNVRMDVSQNKNEKYAILEFSDQATAERNLQLLKGQALNGVVVYVDFVSGQTGVTFVKPQLSPLGDPLKLYVTGFGRDVVVDQLREMFPTSSDISLPLSANDNNRPIGYAFIHYNDEGVAREAHDSMQDYVYQGRTLVVMYGKKTTPDAQNASTQEKRKTLEDTDSPAVKRSKKSEDEEDDEEDDGDEDDDEEEDLDDEEEEEDDEENEQHLL